MDGVQPPPWREVFEGGSPEAEEAIFRTLAEDVLHIQELNRERAGVGHAFRTLHAKIAIGLTDARLVVDRDLPARFRVEHFSAGASLSTTVRLSNASGVPQPDASPDMRGLALKVATSAGSVHDLLMTNYPVSHARTAAQFVAFARIASGDKATMLNELIRHFGQAETERMLSNLRQAVRPSRSLALERFWSRGAILWGGAGPVRVNFRPHAVTEPAQESAANGADDLAAEFVARLKASDICYRMALQEFVDEVLTPIEDGSVEWTEQASASIDVATLVIPRRREHSPESGATAQVDGMAFNPWNAPEAFRPLGNLNRARKIVYAASAGGWLRR